MSDAISCSHKDSRQQIGHKEIETIESLRMLIVTSKDIPQVYTLKKYSTSCLSNMHWNVVAFWIGETFIFKDRSNCSLSDFAIVSINLGHGRGRIWRISSSWKRLRQHRWIVSSCHRPTYTGNSVADAVDETALFPSMITRCDILLTRYILHTTPFPNKTLHTAAFEGYRLQWE